MLGQCARGIVFREFEERTGAPYGVSDPEKSEGRYCTVHRVVLQSTQNSFRAWLPDTTRSPHRVHEFTARSVKGRENRSPENAGRARLARATPVRSCCACARSRQRPLGTWSDLDRGVVRSAPGRRADRRRGTSPRWAACGVPCPRHPVLIGPNKPFPSSQQRWSCTVGCLNCWLATSRLCRAVYRDVNIEDLWSRWSFPAGQPPRDGCNLLDTRSLHRHVGGIAIRS
jgi:hypothetical protein